MKFVSDRAGGMRIRIIAGIAGALVCASAVNAGSQKLWTYAPFGENSSAITISANPDEITSHLYRGQVSFCRAGEKYYCFTSEGLNFSAPKKILDDSTWKSFNDTFHLTKLPVPFRALGREIPVYKISAEKSEMEFYYSDVFGLVSFRLKSANYSPVFIIQERCGFGSSAACRQVVAPE